MTGLRDSRMASVAMFSSAFQIVVTAPPTTCVAISMCSASTVVSSGGATAPYKRSSVAISTQDNGVTISS